MTESSFSQASDRFFELVQDVKDHAGASYSSSDSYHDCFFNLGAAGSLEIILAITVQGKCSAINNARNYFEGRIRLLGRQVSQDEFSHDLYIDRDGLYGIGARCGRMPLQMTMFNNELVSEHFRELAEVFDEDNYLFVIKQIIHHEQVRLHAMCMQAGAPLLWVLF